LSGVIGLSGFWTPVNDASLTNAQAAMAATKDKVDAALARENAEVSAYTKEFQATQQTIQDLTQTFKDEIMDDKITLNSVLIGGILILVIIVIIYLATL